MRALADNLPCAGRTWSAATAASSGAARSGIAMEGEILQHMIGIHFCADLSQWVNHRKCILYWVLNRDVLGVLIAHGLPTEWVLFLPYFSPQQTAEDFGATHAGNWIRAGGGRARSRIWKSKAANAGP